MRGIKFDITIEDIWDLFLKQERKCAFTGQELSMGRETRKDPIERTASLDRKDSSKPYTMDNVQWVHKDINMMKRSLSDERFVQLCKTVAQHCS